MKGVIFTEFLELVESRYGMEVADRVLTRACPLDLGFTSVGTYDYQILIRLILEFGREIEKSPREVILGFGKHLFHRLRVIYPDSTSGVTNTIDFFLRVEDVIHKEVLKLYPEAEVPSFMFTLLDNGVFQIEYISARPFADLAEGLLSACLEHFGDELKIDRVDLNGVPGTHAVFYLGPKVDSP
jgi:hypothetical protein